MEHPGALSYEEALEIEREVEDEIELCAFLEELEKWDEALGRIIDCAFDAFPSLRDVESDTEGCENEERERKE